MLLSRNNVETTTLQLCHVCASFARALSRDSLSGHLPQIFLGLLLIEMQEDIHFTILRHPKPKPTILHTKVSFSKFPRLGLVSAAVHALSMR